jgi:DNA polymerase III epsilon subunit-like protein
MDTPISFNSWFQSKTIAQLKISIKQLDQLIDEQIQIHNINCKNPTNIIPSDYLEYQVERCLDAFKSNIIDQLKLINLKKKFITKDKYPIDKHICVQLYTKNTLMQKAKLFASAHILRALPQLAFVDIETDGTNIETANILQVAIIKPIVNYEHDTLSYIKTWSKYILPYKGYSQKDNKAFHINHIGDEELAKAIEIRNAVLEISFHLCNTVIVGYNVNSFDIPILKRYLAKFNEPFQYKFSIDLYPACWKNKKQKLGDAIKAYNLQNNLNPHDAEADASCCLDLLHKLIERYELPSNEDDLLDLFSSTENIWQYYQTHKVIEINPDHIDYAHLLLPTLASSLKRKHSQI